ncbi:hypothetical protein ACWGKS_21960 [Nocardiopsis sp. NPDC055879]
MLEREQVGNAVITLSRTTDGGFCVLDYLGATFGVAYFDADDEETARRCYANTVAFEREKQEQES